MVVVEPRPRYGHAGVTSLAGFPRPGRIADRRVTDSPLALERTKAVDQFSICCSETTLTMTSSCPFGYRGKSSVIACLRSEDEASKNFLMRP